MGHSGINNGQNAGLQHLAHVDGCGCAAKIQIRDGQIFSLLNKKMSAPGHCQDTDIYSF